jgi:hypothetical protein
MNIEKKSNNKAFWVIVIVFFVLITNLFSPVLLYIFLQTWALIKLRGQRRVFAAVPLLLMIPTIIFSLQLLSQGSNLWPLYLILVSPFACLWLWIAFKLQRGQIKRIGLFRRAVTWAAS